jgi:hypothetical protein
MKIAVIAVLMWVLTILGSHTAATATCGGDCSDDGKVTVNELIVGVSVALGNATLDKCTSIDANGDGEVAINELINAVNASLGSCLPREPRLLALSRDGRIASLEIAAPSTVRESGDLGAVIASARCRDGRCLVVHPSPVDSISVVAASDLADTDTIALERGADPRDVALVDDHTAVVSQYGRPELLELDLTTRTTTPIDLSALADDDGLPEALMLAGCGRRVFVQLLRVDHETGAPATVGAALAVIDLDRADPDRVVDADPATAGVQGIALAGRPDFDMPVDCDAGILYVAEPAPLVQGGGAYEQVDLGTLTARELPIDTGAQVGGFEVVGPDQYWLITHTDFGPGSSSHLNFFGGGPPSDTYNTFASEPVDDLAFDRDEDLLFFPDACSPGPTNPSCETGVHVFHAHTGEPASAEGIAVGFPPIEVVVSR